MSSKKDELLNLNIAITHLIQEIQSKEMSPKEISEINAKIRLQMNQMRNAIDAIRGFAKDEVDEEAELYHSRYINLQNSFRKANVAAQMSITAKNKQELFYADTEGYDTRDRKSKNKDELLKMSSNTTESLLQVGQHLASIVDQSKTTVDTLAHSSQTVADVNEEFRSMGSIIGLTKKLVARYGRRETTDLILILFSFLFFLACCLYVIQKRMF